jgi:hypothetical protein
MAVKKVERELNTLISCHQNRNFNMHAIKKTYDLITLCKRKNKEPSVRFTVYLSPVITFL